MRVSKLGLPTNGVMYCASIGTNAWVINVFGSGNGPDEALESVISEVEKQRTSDGEIAPTR